MSKPLKFARYLEYCGPQYTVIANNVEVRSESGQSGHPRINSSKGGLQIDRIIHRSDG